MFTTGTAVVVSSVGSITYRGNRKQYTAPGEAGKVGRGWGGGTYLSGWRGWWG